MARYHSGESPQKFWKDDAIRILSPTKDLIDMANETEDWNDASYVLLYRAKHSSGGATWKTVLAGDSHDGTWEHILDEHAEAIGSIDLLLAPHHGRDSGRDHSFLDVLKPKLTLFGNASSEHLAYVEWSDRDLPIMTNNQAGSIVVDFTTTYGSVYATNKKFAESELGEDARYDENHKAWLCGFVR